MTNKQTVEEWLDHAVLKYMCVGEPVHICKLSGNVQRLSVGSPELISDDMR